MSWKHGIAQVKWGALCDVSTMGLLPQAERQRLANIPGMLNPHEQHEEMVDA